MLSRKISRMTLVFALAMLVSSLSYAADSSEQEFRDFSKMEPSATVEFDVTSVKLIAGASWGSGTLHYQGKEYPLNVKALSAGGVGYREIKGSGNVYDLKNLEDFPGVYSGGTAGATAGTKGMGAITLENMQRVVLQLTVTDSQGLQVSLGLGGVEVAFDK